ncbi:hypothetical protein NMG60_11026027 [Bertholletia excelsa]
MKSNVNNNTKLILLPYIQKQGTSNRLWLILAFISLFTVAFLLTLVYTRQSIATTVTAAASSVAAAGGSSAGNPQAISEAVVKALIHYASNSNRTDRMPAGDIKPIVDVLRQCTSPCNFLVFGITQEMLLWRALNHHGRTVFIDENSIHRGETPEIEVYDVQYTAKVRETKELIAATRDQYRNECRPVQNLLFSECKLGLNDLPNQLYEVDWHAPGRISAIFTAGVLARSKKAGGSPKTHVFVHDFNMEVDRVSSEEFLCKENLVKAKDMLGHFVVERMEEGSFQFCRNHTTSSSS